MSTTSTQDVHNVFARHENLMRRFGLIAPDERLILSEGSPTYGRAWRLNLGKGYSGAHYNLPYGFEEYLGWSKREAFHELASRNSAILALSHAWGIKPKGDTDS